MKGVRAVRSKVLRGTAAAQRQEVQERIDHRLNNRKVTFKAGSAGLTPKSEKALAEISRSMSQAGRGLRCSDPMLDLVGKAR